MEQYFSDDDDSTSDNLSEGLMRSVIVSGLAAAKDPENYEARSNLMWSATWALNTLIAKGKKQDWMVHMLGQAVSAITNATHGMTLSAVSIPYYRHIMQYGLKKFARFAHVVWEIPKEGKTEEELAAEGIGALEKWIAEIGAINNITELGASRDMLETLADATILLPGGYRKLDRQEVIGIFEKSL